MNSRLSILAMGIATSSLLTACGGGGGSGNFTGQEEFPAAPTVTVSAPAIATVGIAFEVQWSSVNATSCTADFAVETATGATVSVTEASPGSKTYTVTCTGAGGTSSPASTTVTVNFVTTEGLWQGSTNNGRDVTGVVTREGDYWLVYSQSGAPVGFYAGSSASTASTATAGTFSSADLLQVDFGSGAVSAGQIAAANYTTRNSLSGSFDAASSTVTQYTIAGSFNVDALVFGNVLSIPLTIMSGTYDSATGAGSWQASASLAGLGMGTITWDQTFTLDGATGIGVLDSATNCQGNGIACGGIGPEFRGPINAGGAIAAGAQSWVVTTPNFGAPTFAPVLTAVQTGLPSISAHTFNLGTYNSAYEAAPSVASVAGTYNVGWTGIDATVVNAVLINVGADGSISGSEGGCTYAGGPGALRVHASGGNVYDVTVAFSGNACAYDGQSFDGVATYDASSETLMLTALNAARDKGLLVIGSKQ